MSAEVNLQYHMTPSADFSKVGSKEQEGDLCSVAVACCLSLLEGLQRDGSSQRKPGRGQNFLGGW